MSDIILKHIVTYFIKPYFTILCIIFVNPVYVIS